MGFERIDLDDQELERVEQLASLEVSASALAEALEDLPVDQRRAVVARVVQEMSYEEIGHEQATTGIVARKRVSRALSTLRNRLGDRAA